MSSLYAKKGEIYTAYRRDCGPNGDPRILVVEAPTLAMHRDARIERTVARAMERDPVAARTEFGAEWRDDILDFVSVEVVEACTDAGVRERASEPGLRYVAFIDPAGGSGGDSMTLAIAHAGDGANVLDAVRAVPPPFSPEGASKEFAETLKTYGITRVIDDSYAGDWPKEMMRKFGIDYERSEMPKTALYAAFLPLLNSRGARLLDHPTLKRELCAWSAGRTGAAGTVSTTPQEAMMT